MKYLAKARFEYGTAECLFDSYKEAHKWASSLEEGLDYSVIVVEDYSNILLKEAALLKPEFKDTRH